MTEPKKRRLTPLSAKTIQRQIDTHRAEEERIRSEFKHAVREARKKNPWPLHEVLGEMVEHGLSLLGSDILILRELLLRGGRQNRQGRRVIAVSLIEMAQQRVIQVARKRLAEMRKRSGGRVPTDGNYKRAVRHAICWLIHTEEISSSKEKDLPESAVTENSLNYDYIVNTLKRGKRKPKK